MVMPDNKAKVSPEAHQSIMLDEIAGRLADIHEELKSHVARGNVYGIPVSVSEVASQIVLLFSGTIYNDGAADIYILESDRNIGPGDTPLKSGESISIDTKKQGSYTYWLKTLAGTATVRIFALA